MRIDILTLFPETVKTLLDFSIIGRAIDKEKVDIQFHNIRDYAENKHKKVDDTPYGGGGGMILQAQPIYFCYKSVRKILKENPYVVFLSPSGKKFNQEKAKELCKKKNLMLICGHYEGFDQRIIEKIGDEELSIGDYVLTGGELPACVVTDAVCRLLPGVLSSPDSFEKESHYNGLLEHSQYTKPPIWEGLPVPEILLSGHHGNIEEFKKEMSIEKTKKVRPDLFDKKTN